MSDSAPLLIGQRETRIILAKIGHGPRPHATLRVWNAALSYAASGTGVIEASGTQLAEQAGTAETGVSRALSRLAEIGALIRTGRGRYAINPAVAWSGSLASSEQAAAAQKLGPRLVEPV
jgi:predicted transcriptional regulator of viral defense system